MRARIGEGKLNAGKVGYVHEIQCGGLKVCDSPPGKPWRWGTWCRRDEIELLGERNMTKPTDKEVERVAKALNYIRFCEAGRPCSHHPNADDIWTWASNMNRLIATLQAEWVLAQIAKPKRGKK